MIIHLCLDWGSWRVTEPSHLAFGNEPGHFDKQSLKKIGNLAVKKKRCDFMAKMKRSTIAQYTDIIFKLLGEEGHHSIDDGYQFFDRLV